MYQAAYAETLGTDSSHARQSEREAILNTVMLLEAAIVAGTRSVERTHALYSIRRLWTYFIEQLADPANTLPNELRAQLISIGLWILAEEDRIRNGQSNNLAGIADVSRTIAAGLT
jgi:flagellar biosynthesis activator protein FlaF